MNRVTRISSAALGMLLLAGLAYYQGHSDPTMGQAGALVGTAVQGSSEKRDVDCDKPDSLDKKDSEYCAAKARAAKEHLN